MYTDILEELGFSTNEAKIYETLVTYGGSGVSTIALRSKIHRRNVYDTVNRLLEKGLIYEVYRENETLYEPVNPSKLLDVADERSRKVRAALPKMLSTFHTHKVAEHSAIYKGIEGLKNYMRDALHVGQDIYTIGSKGAWFDPRLADYSEWFLKEAERKRITMHVLFDDEVREAIPHIPSKLSSHYKFLPKKYSSTSAVDIFGDHIVMFSGLALGKWLDDITVFVTVSKPLADTYRLWWQLLWDTLPEPKKGKKK